MKEEPNTVLREPTQEELACGTFTTDLAVEYGVSPKTVTNWCNSASILFHRNGKRFVILADDLPRFRAIAEQRTKAKVQEVEVINENTSHIDQGFREESSTISLMIREAVEEGRELAMACEQAKWLAYGETRQTLGEMLWGRRSDIARVRPPSLDEVRSQLNQNRSHAGLLSGVA